MKIENDWIGQMSKWVLSDSAALKLYLDVIGKCPDYSVNNQLLLMYESQEKPFTMIKAHDTWENQGVAVNQDAAAYYIWEPDKDANGAIRGAGVRGTADTKRYPDSGCGFYQERVWSESYVCTKG